MNLFSITVILFMLPMSIWTVELEAVEGLDVDRGFHDFGKIEDSDLVVLSPGLWNKPAFQQIKSENKLLSDVVTSHRSLFTIGVTGTNGKTTTTMMIGQHTGKCRV